MIRTFLTIENHGLSEQVFGDVPSDGVPNGAAQPPISENGNAGDGVQVAKAEACDLNPSSKRGQTDGTDDEPAMKLQKIQDHAVDSTGTTSATEETVLQLVASCDGVRHF
jgi:ATP-dependent DNA helicase RecQ